MISPELKLMDERLFIDAAMGFVLPKRLINRSIMMDFSLTEEQELPLASIRELITTNFPEEYFRTCDQTGHIRVSLCGAGG